MPQQHFARMLLTAGDGETLVMRCPWRRPPELVGESAGARLVRGIFSGGLTAGEVSALRADLLTLKDLTGDPLFSDTLLLPMGGALRRASVTLRNTQFVAADRTCVAFRWGYEPDTMALIDLLVGDAGHYVDIGANFGYFPLFLASRPGFTGAITAFEPAPGPCADLLGLVQALGVADRIRVERLGLSDQAGEAHLSQEVWSGSARIDASAQGPAISLARLDDLDLPAAALIKADVEFHEAAVFRGGAGYLARHKPCITFEMHKTDDLAAYRAPFDVLEALGYRFALPGCTPVLEGPEASASHLELTLSIGIADTPAERPEYYNVFAFHPESPTLMAHAVAAAGNAPPAS